MPSDVSDFVADPDRILELAERSIRRGYQLRRRRRALLGGGPAIVIAIVLMAALLGGGHEQGDRLRVTRPGPDRREPTTVPSPDGGPPAIGGLGAPGPGQGFGRRASGAAGRPASGSSGAAAAGAHARIVFSDADVKVIDDDGSSPRLIIRDAHGAILSPDGRKLVYTRNVPSGSSARIDLLVAPIDGSGERRVSSGNADATLPAWAPDSRSLAYVSAGAGTTTSDIHVVSADGSGDRALTNDGISSWPSWAPDGKRIAFDKAGSSALYVMSEDGSGVTKIGPPNMVAGRPRWSPDGRLIAFLGYDSAAPFDAENSNGVRVMNADGTDVRQFGGGWIDMAWSPDGSWLALSGSVGLEIVHPDTTGARRLSHRPFETQPAWSLDGEQLAFGRAGDDTSPVVNELWVIGVDGTHGRRIADLSGNFTPSPCWVPAA